MWLNQNKYLKCYSLNIANLTTLYFPGTPPNLVLRSIFEATFPGQKSLDYQEWLQVAFPLSLILIIAGWTLLSLIYARSSYWNLITLRSLWKSGLNNALYEQVWLSFDSLMKNFKLSK